MRTARFLALTSIAIVFCELFAASALASEPGWAGPGWYIWNKAIWAPALSAREGASAGPFPTKEQCEAARPANLFNGQAIPVFECFYFASEADFERKLEQAS